MPGFPGIYYEKHQRTISNCQLNVFPLITGIQGMYWGFPTEIQLSRKDYYTNLASKI